MWFQLLQNYISCCQKLSWLLNENEFLLGCRPCTLDALVFSHLSVLRELKSSLCLDLAEPTRDNLIKYLDRLSARSAIFSVFSTKQFIFRSHTEIDVLKFSFYLREQGSCSSFDNSPALHSFLNNQIVFPISVTFLKNRLLKSPQICYHYLFVDESFIQVCASEPRLAQVQLWHVLVSGPDGHTLGHCGLLCYGHYGTLPSMAPVRTVRATSVHRSRMKSKFKLHP